MEKIAIVKSAQELLPEEIINGTISLNGQVLPLSQYMEEHLISIVNETTTPEYLATIIVTRFKAKIRKGKTRAEKENYIDTFLNSLFDRKEEIRLTEETVINVREYLLANALPFMDADFLITIGPHKRTLEEFYLRILSNEYKPYTKAEKAETCLSFIEYLSEEVLSAIMPEHNVSVREYLGTILPDMLVNATDVLVNGETMRIDTHIKNVEASILKSIESAIEIPGLREGESYGNPSRVGEITLSMASDQTVKVASDIPFIPLPGLTDEERFSITYHEGKAATLTESELVSRMNNLMDAIRNVNSEHDLANIENEVQELKSDSEEFIHQPYIKEKLSTIDALIQEKRKNIIKTESNKEDYIDALQGRITSLKERLRDCQDVEVYDQVFGEITAIQIEVAKKRIIDYQLLATIEAFKKDIAFRRLKTDALKTNQSKEIERIKNEIDDYIRQVKQDVFHMESENKLSAIAGIQIRIARAYDNTLTYINEAQRAGFLTAEEAEYYKTQLDGVMNNVQEKNRKIS